MRPKRSIIPVFVPHSGCPHDCVFCDQRKISGEISAPEPGELAVFFREALQYSRGEKREIAFYGGSFTAIEPSLRKAYLDSAKPFLDDGTVESIRISTRPDCIDASAAAELKSAGVATVELGIQSMDDGALTASGRGHTAGDGVRAVEILKRHGLSVILQMMVGLPGGSAEEAVRTAEVIAGLKPDGARIYPTVVLEGTKLADMRRAGEYRPLGLAEAVERCVKPAAVFVGAGIPILRIGLNASELLSGGGAVAGPYHPAFGELVYSELYYGIAAKVLRSEPAWTGRAVTVYVPFNRVSAMAGHKGSNRDRLTREFGLKALKIKGAELPEGGIIIE
ncbi:radical SAM protein [Clostridia bacterium]|nr:radical SAM protein [Clostridia bacterium]